jgi:hypothetical protein
VRSNFFFLLFLLSFQARAQDKILFVGNSLTYSNDLPTLVQKIAKADGKKISVEMIARPNYALQDHWEEGKVQEVLSQNKFDYAIFQQGPSALLSSRKNLVEYALKFSQLCKANKAQMSLYTVWPSGDRSFDFPNVIASYTMAADTTQALLLPAGLAWFRTLERRKDFPLYSSDGFHPTIHGSMLAAMVIYGKLFRKVNFDFMTLKTVPSKYITAVDLNVMKSVATEVCRD